MSLGIENLKRAIGFGVSFAKQIEVSGKDGWDWKDSFSFFDEIMQVPGIINSGDSIVAEFKDLDMAERSELQDYFVAEFDLENDRIEAIVENALELVLQVLALLVLFKKPAPVTE